MRLLLPLFFFVNVSLTALGTRFDGPSPHAGDCTEACAATKAECTEACGTDNDTCVATCKRAYEECIIGCE